MSISLLGRHRKTKFHFMIILKYISTCLYKKLVPIISLTILWQCLKECFVILALIKIYSYCQTVIEVVPTQWYNEVPWPNSGVTRPWTDAIKSWQGCHHNVLWPKVAVTGYLLQCHLVAVKLLMRCIIINTYNGK